MSRVDNELWQPRSDCGPRCLPAPDAPMLLGRIRQLGRLLSMLGVVLLGVGLLPVLPVLNARGRHLAGRTWARTVLRVLGIRLEARGRLPQRRALLVANHISWLDIVSVLAVSPSRMLAKHEVRAWPLFGALAAAAGTIFVDRTRPRALPETVAEVSKALRADGVVTVFPEGTTWCGAPNGSVDCGGSGRFRPAMFQAAIDTGAVVVPLTIGYRTGSGREGTTAAAFLGDDSLWVSLRRVLAVPKLVISVTAAPALHPEADADRRTLARVAESAARMSRPAGPARVPAADTGAPVGAVPLVEVVPLVGVVPAVPGAGLVPSVDLELVPFARVGLVVPPLPALALVPAVPAVPTGLTVPTVPTGSTGPGQPDGSVANRSAADRVDHQLDHELAEHEFREQELAA